MKLNKNQKRFFEQAIAHFKDKADDVRLKDLTKFAEDNGLIVPTSALKNYCIRKNTIRGHYDLTLTGISYTQPIESSGTEKIEESEEQVTPHEEHSVIVETSSFVEPAHPQKPKQGHYKPEPHQKKKVWKNPVYVVSNGSGDVIGVHYNLKDAFKRRYRAFSDWGTMDYEDFIVRMEYVGAVIINSSNSQLTCLIETHELE